MDIIERDKPPEPIGSKVLKAVGFILLGLIFVAIMLACGGCSSEPPPETGEVINRKYEPEHWEGGYESHYENEYVCGYKSAYDYDSGEYNSKYRCDWEDVEHQRYEEHHIWRENEWSLLLRKCEKKDDGKEKCREGWRTITSDEYDRHDIGDYYPKTKEN